jgi:hypothetical protein
MSYIWLQLPHLPKEASSIGDSYFGIVYQCYLLNNINTGFYCFSMYSQAQKSYPMELSTFMNKSSDLVTNLILKYTFLALASCNPAVLFGFQDTNYNSIIRSLLRHNFVPTFLKDNSIVNGPLTRIYDGILNIIDIDDLFGRNLEVIIVELYDGLHASVTTNIPFAFIERKIIVFHKNVLIIRALSYGFSQVEMVKLAASFINICLREGMMNINDMEKINVIIEGAPSYKDMDLLECMVNWSYLK